MNDYDLRLKEIGESQASAEERLRIVDAIYRIKPVRLQWYIVKARIVQDCFGDFDRAGRIIADKYMAIYLYEGIEEINKFLQDRDNLSNDIFMAEYRDYCTAQLKHNRALAEGIRDKLARKERMLEEEEISLADILPVYLTCGKWTTYYILKLYESYIGQCCDRKRFWIAALPNMGYLKECVERRSRVILCVDNLQDRNEGLILANYLSKMGCPINVLDIPVRVDVEAYIDMADTVLISMDNAEKKKDFVLIPPIELALNGELLGDNSAQLVHHLCDEEGTALILASSIKFEKLSRSGVLKNKIDNLSGYQENFRTSHYAFGWCGSYLGYISQLYDMDAKAAVYREPECKFSIVIPVRNSAATLQHTLKTCLNQRYQGDFEIVVSDNSTDGNMEVWQYCQSLEDDRVRYYKTPRNLNLSRSFEYAFLQSRGEFVFSIGADDGVLPWGLEVLAELTEKYPEEEIILWDRGFYAWPGFNKGQENQFCVPKRYRKGQYREGYVEPIQGLGAAMENPQAMYGLPLLYINSGFRRSFMKTLLKDTGRLWDGICQDIYMGTVISTIKEKILYLPYPITIAGMSSNSMGAISTLPLESQEKGAAYANRIVRENNVGGFAKSQIETFAPELGSDVSSLYNSILRAVNRGLIPARYLKEVFDWKQWFMNIYRVLSKKDVYFDRKLHQMRFAAMKHGEEFLKWFDENIYADALVPVVFNETDNNAKTYKEEEGDKIVLDASRYGVHNIYEASQLFERLTGL